ncbi:hypothetical protein TCAL_00272 [Tigriopus californicus]|uniref:Uncharacterized protein n=1 Tax=Tigriopus californicus TaxID=6832 RepID=A0A553P3A8_TIGCA|nr:hypothetical protein TCAL_00272 [Tigriopus californicus]
MLREISGKGQPYSLAIRQQTLSDQSLKMMNGSSSGRVEFSGPVDSSPRGQLLNSPRPQDYCNPQHHVYSLNHFEDQDQSSSAHEPESPPPASSPECHGLPGPSSPSLRTVHFQLQARFNSDLTESPFSNSRVKGCRKEERCFVHANGLAEASVYDVEPPPLPPPSQYATDSPIMNTQNYPYNKNQPMQQHFVSDAPSGTQEPVLEKSFVTFCPPNLETKSWDVVNATRL